MVGYSKYTILLEEPDFDVVKSIATSSEENKVTTKAFLEAKNKTKIVEFTREELLELYNKLLD